MFGLFKKNVSVEKVEEKPMACADVAVASSTKGRPGRVLTKEALRAHDAVVEVLNETPATRHAIIAKLAPELQGYVNGNWQNIILRLVAQNKAKLAEGSRARGRGVSYTKA